MPTRTFQVAVLVALTILASLTRADTPQGHWQGLIDHSPFGESGNPPAKNLTMEPPLEFRGVLEENGRTIFSLFDRTMRRSYWLEPNTPANNVAVKSYDAAITTLTVEYHAQTLTLPLKGAATNPPAHTAKTRPSSTPRIAPEKSRPTQSHRDRFTQEQEYLIRQAVRQSTSTNTTASPPKTQPAPIKK